MSQIIKKLVIDIETIGEDFDELDETSREVLTRWIKKESKTDKEYRIALADLKNNLGFSPLTGEIVAIGILNPDTNKGAVYFQAPKTKIQKSQENDYIFESMSEKKILQKFWETVSHYQEFITFNGRGFDLPFILVRSAIYKIRSTKNLMSNRYLNSQKFDSKHIDLFDQLNFYGSVSGRRGNLHLWCRTFGIKSPKIDGISGDDVSRLFAEKKFLEIARYNAADLKATKELYEIWNNYLRF